MASNLGPLMVDVAGLRLSQEEHRRLHHPLVGGVILFSRNYRDKRQLTQLVNEIKLLRSPPLLIAVDQEGGRVQRFRDGFTVLPSAASLGRQWHNNKQQALVNCYSSGRIMASELRQYPIDFSFAPVFDITSVDSEVIGDRCFHPQPEIASELLAAYIDGMKSAGMVAIAKHFPGHGGVAEDSHYCLPVDSRSIDAIRAHDLLPYKLLINDIHGVMMSHVVFPNCDDQIASYSTYWIHTVLRRELGFTGVIFSDDLSMHAAQKEDISPGQNVSSALQAGCDMVLICNQPEVVDQVLQEGCLLPQPNPQISALYGRQP